MKVCVISGSARSGNNTLRVAKALERLMKGHSVTLVDFQHYDIPLILQGDVTPGNLTPFQRELVEAMDQAHVTILISPEYNWSTTPEILNFLHRLGDHSFKHIFNNTTFAVVGVSTGKGGKAPALHIITILNKIISFMDLDAFVSAKIFEAHYTKDVLDENGASLGNAMFDRGLQAFVDYTLRVAERWFK